MIPYQDFITTEVNVPYFINTQLIYFLFSIDCKYSCLIQKTNVFACFQRRKSFEPWYLLFWVHFNLAQSTTAYMIYKANDRLLLWWLWLNPSNFAIMLYNFEINREKENCTSLKHCLTMYCKSLQKLFLLEGSTAI